MSKIEVNTVAPQCGTTLTLGESGDTVTLGSGASQSGFGRTGTVNWDTTKKTAGFTGVSGNGYFIDTTSGAITVNLPASPSAGDIMALADYAGTAGTNAITVGRNGSNIEGLADNAIININRESKTLVFVDATQGWLPVNDNADPISDSKFVTATGGTVTCSGNFKIHTFTGPGTFCVSCAGNSQGSSTVDYLVVAGGGGGYNYAGGGGAGGYRESSGAASGCYAISPLGAGVSALPVSVTGYPITVGGGGTGAPGPFSPLPVSCAVGNPGSNSIFSTITSTGGGGGGGYSATAPNPNTAPNVVGQNGGSGGGGGNPTASSATPGNTPAAGGSGNTPSVSPPQGNNGGTGDSDNSAWRSGGGGGGAGATGSNLTPSPSGKAGNGGNGVASSINGTPTSRGGGGGGGTNLTPAPSSSTGGSGGGGGYSACGPQAGTNGTANTGGGGSGSANLASGSGGSGIVIIRYKFQ